MLPESLEAPTHIAIQWLSGRERKKKNQVSRFCFAVSGVAVALQDLS